MEHAVYESEEQSASSDADSSSVSERTRSPKTELFSATRQCKIRVVASKSVCRDAADSLAPAGFTVVGLEPLREDPQIYRMYLFAPLDKLNWHKLGGQ